METYSVRHESGETRGRFVIDLEGGTEAELTYSKAGDRQWIADHTGVPSAFEGQGIASQLVKAMVAEAEKAGVTILPLCSYVAAWAKRHPEQGERFAR